MSFAFKTPASVKDLELADDVLFEAELDGSPYPDDLSRLDTMANQIKLLLDSVTRVGGEVSRLRSEVDELLQQNHLLVDSFTHLKDVTTEKGSLDLDDFELACDVLEVSTESFHLQPARKLAS